MKLRPPRLVLPLALATVLVGSMAAADERATLWLIVDHHGSTTVHLRLLDRPTDVRRFTAALESIIEGRTTSVAVDSTSPMWAAYGVSSAGMKRQGAMFSATVDLRALMAALRDEDRAASLEVIFQHPRGPSMARNPPGAIVQRRIASGPWFELPVDAPVQPWAVEFGFPPDRVAWAIGLPLALLAASIAWLAWLRLAAGRAAQRDASRVWFGYARGTHWTVLGTWVAWCGAVHALETSRLVELQLDVLPWVLGGLVIVALYMIPPALVALLATSWTHGIMVKIRGIEWSHDEAMKLGVMQIGAFTAAIGGIVIALRAPSLGPMLGIMAVAVTLALVLAMRARRMQGISLHALSTGPLRDRVFGLAEQAGVRIKQVYLLPMARIRIANAFAVQGETVMLSDYLLRHLSRREVDAVVAHEVVHLRKGHPRAIALMMGGACGIGVLGSWITAGATGWIVLGCGLLVWVLLFLLMSRRFERTADAGAAALTGDPEAMISALAKLNRLNHMPVEWGPWDESLLTHPSTSRRARAIGTAAGVAPERIAELLRADVAADEHYAIPEVEGQGSKLFSTTYKSSAATRISLTVTAIIVFTPIVIVYVARLIAWYPVNYAVFAVFGLVITPTLALAALNRMAVAPLRPLARQQRDRLAAQGLDPGPSSIFVGFSPDAVPRVYELFYDWDVGHLVQNGDAIAYLGEETRFALRRDQVVAIETVAGAASWIPVRRVRITWQAEPGEAARAFLFRPADVPTLGGSTAAARSLHRWLDAWWKGSSTVASLAAPLGPPALGEVTSISPRAIAGRKQSFLGLSVVGILAFGAAAGLLGSHSGFGLLYTVAVATLTQTFLLVPYWRYRDPKPPPLNSVPSPSASNATAA